MTKEKINKPIYKKWWFWAIIIFIGIGAVGSINDKAEGTAKEKPVVKQTVDKKAKPKTDKITSEIDNAADPHFGKVKSVQINEDMGKNDGGKIVLVHVKQDGLTKRTVDYNTTRVLRKVFEIDKVNEITYFWEATLVGDNGKKTVTTVVKIQMSKETAKTIDWNNFSYNNLEKVADSYNASPAVK